MQYLSSNMHKFSQVTIILLCNFDKHSDFILGLHIQKKFAVLKSSSQSFQSICQNFQIGKFVSSAENKRYFFALGIMG